MGYLQHLIERRDDELRRRAEVRAHLAGQAICEADGACGVYYDYPPQWYYTHNRRSDGKPNPVDGVMTDYVNRAVAELGHIILARAERLAQKELDEANAELRDELRTIVEGR